MSITNLPNIDSEQLAKYHEKLDSLKIILLDKGLNIRMLVTYNALEVAIASHGGKTALIKQILGDSISWKEFCAKELTPEEIAEFEEIERQEKEQMMQDFTPRIDTHKVYNDVAYLAQWLFSEAELDGEKGFDELFEKILINRYDKFLMAHNEQGKIEVWSKVKTLEDSESILT